MSLLRSSGMLIVAVMGANLLAYGFHMLAGRYLGPAGYGEFGVLISLFTLLAIPYNGLTLALTKVLGDANQNAEYNPHEIVNAFSRISVKTIILYGLSLLLTYFFWYDGLNISDPVSLIILFAMFNFASFHWLVSGQIKADREYRKLSTLQILEGVARLLVFGILILFFKPNVSGVLFAFTFGFILPSMLYPNYLIRLFRIQGNQKINIVKSVRNRWVIYSVIISIKNLVLIGTTNFSLIFVAQWLEPEEIGFWNAALTIARVNQFAAIAISTVLFAEAVNIQSRHTHRLLAIKSSVLFGAIALSIVLLFFIVPQIFIIPLFGSNFRDAQVYLPWIGAGTALLGLVQIWADYLLARYDLATRLR